jgi:hypothetical protein
MTLTDALSCMARFGQFIDTDRLVASDWFEGEYPQVEVLELHAAFRFPRISPASSAVMALPK